MKKLYKLVGFTLAFGVIAVLLFSKWGLGLDFDPSKGAVSFALSIALALGGTALFIFVYYTVLTKKEEPTIKVMDLTTTENCISALEECKKTDPVFRREIEQAVEQLKILERRKIALNTLLRQNGEEERYQYLNETVQRANFYVFANIKRIINRFIVFDNEEFEKNPQSYDLREYQTTIREIIEDNATILKEYSDMLMALSSIGNTETAHPQEIRDMTNALNKVLNGEHFASLEKEYNNNGGI